MQNFKPLTETELETIFKVRDLINSETSIPCTGCRYCVEGDSCPMHILIPDDFSLYNANIRYAHSDFRFYYLNLVKAGNGLASACVGCKQCERVCPQHLEITSLLKLVADELES